MAFWSHPLIIKAFGIGGGGFTVIQWEQTGDTWAKGYVAKLSLGLGSITGPASVLGRGTHPSPSAVTSAASEWAKAPRWPLLPYTVHCGHRKGVRPDQCLLPCCSINRPITHSDGPLMKWNQFITISEKEKTNVNDETLSTQTLSGSPQASGTSGHVWTFLKSCTQSKETWKKKKRNSDR